MDMDMYIEYSLKGNDKKSPVSGSASVLERIFSQEGLDSLRNGAAETPMEFGLWRQSVPGQPAHMLQRRRLSRQGLVQHHVRVHLACVVQPHLHQKVDVSTNSRFE